MPSPLTRLAALLFACILPAFAQATEISLSFATPDGVFSPSYKSIPGDATKALIVPSGGKPREEEGKLVLDGSRFTIGAVSNDAGKITQSTSESRPVGVLNLSMPYKIIVRVAEVASVTPGKDHFFIYVNNSSSGADDSPLGKNSQLTKIPVSKLKIGDNEFNANYGDKTSFLQIRAESGAIVKLESLRIVPR